MNVTEFEPLTSERYLKEPTDYILNDQKKLPTGYKVLDEELNGGLMCRSVLETHPSPVSPLKNVDEITSVPGLDAVIIGPHDLSVSMGYGIPIDWDNPTYAAAFDKVVQSANKNGIHAGIFALSHKLDWLLEKGYKFNAIDDADMFLQLAAGDALSKARDLYQKHGM